MKTRTLSLLLAFLLAASVAVAAEEPEASACEDEACGDEPAACDEVDEEGNERCTEDDASPLGMRPCPVVDMVGTNPQVSVNPILGMFVVDPYNCYWRIIHELIDGL